MPPGRLAHRFCRRLIVDAFVGHIPRRRLRRALDDGALYALVDGVTSIVLVQFLAPHASGNENLEIQWRPATLSEAKAVVSHYHKHLSENGLIKSIPE